MPFEVSAETLQVLEWPRIVDWLRSCCRTAMGAERAASLAFCSTRVEVELELTRAEELVELAELGEAGLPLAGARDCRAALTRVDKAGVLEPKDLLDVLSTLRTVREVR